MLIDVVKDYSVVMPELIAYLQSRNYDVGSFLTKTDISFQFIVINEFLIEKYSITIIVNPYKVLIVNYTGLTSKEYEILFSRELPTDFKTNKTIYYALINMAFKYLQNTPF